jgi:hypothetical protein
LSEIGCPSSTLLGLIGDPTIANAVLDRLVRNPHRLILKVASLQGRLSVSGRRFCQRGNHSNQDCFSNR